MNRTPGTVTRCAPSTSTAKAGLVARRADAAHICRDPPVTERHHETVR
jgi:hypothetical protein